ncbi:MAG TPA: ATP synthase F1 subunit delta [Thermoanaerobaculia bacterium]|nr:ATP synthase F1 subunit delta [Thermoanaerobaculia bacterium]
MMRGFARPYASAMMQIAGTPDQAKTLHAEVERFEKARHSSAELIDLFDSPAIDLKKKAAIIETIAKRLELSDIARRLLQVLAQNDRINSLPIILLVWNEMINAALGVVVARVRTAHALSAEEQTRLAASLERKFGRRVDLSLETDPSLLAGFVAQVGSEIYDASIAGRINKFRESLT